MPFSRTELVGRGMVNLIPGERISSPIPFPVTSKPRHLGLLHPAMNGERVSGPHEEMLVQTWEAIIE